MTRKRFFFKESFVYAFPNHPEFKQRSGTPLKHNIGIAVLYKFLHTLKHCVANDVFCQITIVIGKFFDRYSERFAAVFISSLRGSFHYAAVAAVADLYSGERKSFSEPVSIEVLLVSLFRKRTSKNCYCLFHL